MSGPRRSNEKPPPDRGARATHYPHSDPITLAICGNPVVGQALVLLLRGPGYDARFLPASSLSEPGSLEGVRLLLLVPTPELSTKRREALLASFRDTPGAAEVLVLELILSFGGSRDRGVRDVSERAVPWPCSTEELKRRIEAALLAEEEAGRTARRDSQIGEGERHGS